MIWISAALLLLGTGLIIAIVLEPILTPPILNSDLWLLAGVIFVSIGALLITWLFLYSSRNF